VTRTTPQPKGLRRVERWLVGLAMAIVAFLLERIVVRGMRRRGERVDPEEPEPTTLTSRGGEVDLDEL
jgi:hypothetical protein